MKIPGSKKYFGFNNQKSRPFYLFFFSFFHYQGVVQNEFVPSGSTVNVAFYENVLGGLCKRITRVKPTLWKIRSVLLAAKHRSNMCTSLFSIFKFSSLFRVPKFENRAQGGSFCHHCIYLGRLIILLIQLLPDHGKAAVPPQKLFRIIALNKTFVQYLC